jgi:dihydrofolate reductase
VCALDRDYAIGRDGALPWHLPDDLQPLQGAHARPPMLMGRKTAQALGRALPGARNLVLTRSGRVPFEGMEAVASVDEARARPARHR